MNLRKAAEGQSCVRCGIEDGSIVLAHYTGVRRGAYGGGLSLKCHDIFGAHLCGACHRYMDTESRDRAKRWEHSEEFQHYILLTIKRLLDQEVLK
jgi:uncharacterized Fe-S cluster-containing radical SAM superfamily protein